MTTKKLAPKGEAITMLISLARKAEDTKEKAVLTRAVFELRRLKA